MPHYPDEIEYSDKYTDDHYEYRHVILPKDVYKKIPRSRLLTESVARILSRNGAPSASSSPAAGSTMNFTALSPTSSCSAEPRELTLRPASLPLDSCLPQMPSAIEPSVMINDASTLNCQLLKSSFIANC